MADYITPDTLDNLSSVEEVSDVKEQDSQDQKYEQMPAIPNSEEALVKKAEDLGLEGNFETKEDLIKAIENKIKQQTAKPTNDKQHTDDKEIDDLVDIFEEVPPELEAFKKSLLRKYHAKSQEAAAERSKAAIVDALNANPEEALVQIISRFGLQDKFGLGQTPGTPVVPTKPEVGPAKIKDIEFKDGDNFVDYIKQVIVSAVPHALQDLGYNPNQQQRQQQQLPYQQPQANPYKAKGEQFLNNLYADFPDWEKYQDNVYKLVDYDPMLLDDHKKAYTQAKALYNRQQDSIQQNSRMTKRHGTSIRTGERGKPMVKIGNGKKSRYLSFNEAWDLSERQLKLSKNE